MSKMITPLFSSVVYGPVPVALRHPASRELQPYGPDVIVREADFGKIAVGLDKISGDGLEMLRATIDPICSRPDGSPVTTLLGDQLMLFSSLEEAKRHRVAAGLMHRRIHYYQALLWTPPDDAGQVPPAPVGVCLEIILQEGPVVEPAAPVPLVNGRHLH